MTAPLSVLHVLGAGLILCAGLLTRRALLGESRRIQRTRRALAAAFEGMEAEIRLLLTPVPALLRRTCSPEAEAFFCPVRERLSHGESLPEAWHAAAAVLSLPPDERETIASLGARLDGGEESACAALTLTASELRRAYAREEEKRGETERLTTSICLCISLLAALLLL